MVSCYWHQHGFSMLKNSVCATRHLNIISILLSWLGAPVISRCFNFHDFTFFSWFMANQPPLPQKNKVHLLGPDFWGGMLGEVRWLTSHDWCCLPKVANSTRDSNPIHSGFAGEITTWQNLTDPKSSMEKKHETKHKTSDFRVVATQIFFYFHPENWGRWTHFDYSHIFLVGLKAKN